MKSKQLPIFCFSQRNLDPKGIIVHYFSCKNVDEDNSFDLESCRNLMIDLNRAKDERAHYLEDDRSRDARMYASAHIFIGRKGETWKLVNFNKQAYHAGVSFLNGVPGCNQWTIGIEMIGTSTSGFTDHQYCSLAALCHALMGKHGFGLESIAGHDTVRYKAIMNGKKAANKYDPSGTKDGTGDNFDWEKLESFMDMI